MHEIVSLNFHMFYTFLYVFYLTLYLSSPDKLYWFSIRSLVRGDIYSWIIIVCLHYTITSLILLNKIPFNGFVNNPATIDSVGQLTILMVSNLIMYFIKYPISICLYLSTLTLSILIQLNSTLFVLINVFHWWCTPLPLETSLTKLN